MSWIEISALFSAGMAAGMINTIVGSGSLVTFPTLLAFGLPPVTANVTNTIGLVPGSLSGAIGYRRELRGQGSRMIRLGVAACLGGALGAGLLLWLPARAFDTIVPALILLGCALVIAGPTINRRAGERSKDSAGSISGFRTNWVAPAVAATGVYGGYFGAAQGVLLIAILSIGINDDLQRLNALKNVLAMLVNAVAAVIFVFVSHVDWPVAIILALGAALGGQIGAGVGRRLPAWVLRTFIVLVGLTAVIVLI
ncbi:MAG TPA: sulfite exporter TauE/SafE family protein, partial [Marmoricola sp.]|nr:sulfite exporter TauE/SafE family protein [Marmoricola sp.]